MFTRNMNGRLKLIVLGLILFAISFILISVGTNESFIVLFFCVLFGVMIADDMRQRIMDNKKDNAITENMTIESFFNSGGIAYYFRKGSEWKKCKTYDEFQNIKFDYLCFYLNGKRYILESQTNTKDEK